jgi:DNA-binding winged helix-turn-helix (wHTH) protein
MAELWRFGPFTVDEDRQRVSCGGQPVELTPKSYKTLLHLVRNPGCLVTRRELIETVWPDTVVEEGNLHWTVSAVRKALAAHDPGGVYIATARGQGYRFVRPVEPGRTAVTRAAGLPPRRTRPWRLGLLAGVLILPFVLTARGGPAPPTPPHRADVAPARPRCCLERTGAGRSTRVCRTRLRASPLSP